MKIRYLLSIVVLTLLAAVASAGRFQPATVIIDFDNMFAQGDMRTARTAKNDFDLIGCGIRVFDDGVNSFAFGFCQARDSDDNFVVCITESPDLLVSIGAIDSLSFITFSWQGDDPDDFECTRIGSSTQSFYLPNFTTKGSK